MGKLRKLNFDVLACIFQYVDFRKRCIISEMYKVDPIDFKPIPFLESTELVIERPVGWNNWSHSHLELDLTRVHIEFDIRNTKRKCRRTKRCKGTCASTVSIFFTYKRLDCSCPYQNTIFQIGRHTNEMKVCNLFCPNVELTLPDEFCV